ncbi:outer membrane immunogenic protein [Rhizobium sp. RU20A]|uniref:outer membrane protein n=1 Tax=Rhizobium sp. RU20A TaxID=1907412 RepID=UPI0009557AEE|nr:outer membrane protein [Rhizobium sp. RU20A]SIR32298.1 outer membrane immunogenic protein [Rhizobium sp. RU20A]
MSIVRVIARLPGLGRLALSLAAGLAIGAVCGPTAAAAQDTFSWSGFYIGGVAGYNWNDDLTSEYITATGAARGITFPYDPEGGSIGLKAGINFEAGSFVYGVEGDFERTNIKGTFIDRIENIGRGDDTYDWQASLRARMGISMDRFMVYGTGGVAVARIENKYTLVPFGISENFKDTHTGWTAGAGVDYAITDNLIAGLEYRFTKFEKFSNVSTVAFPGLTGTQEPTSNALRFSLSYKF